MMSNVVTQQIVDWKVNAPSVAEPQVSQTLERDEIITGSTYKTKILDHTYYITINDVTINGVRRPYEVFINSKNVENFAHLTVLTRLISAFFRTGHEYAFIATELQQIINPIGGYFKKSKRYESLEAELGDILEKHFISLSDTK